MELKETSSLMMLVYFKIAEKFIEILKVTAKAAKHRPGVIKLTLFLVVLLSNLTLSLKGRNLNV